MRRGGLAQLTMKKVLFVFMYQIKFDESIISLCLGWLVVSILLTPSLTPDFLFVDLGLIVLE